MKLEKTESVRANVIRTLSLSSRVAATDASDASGDGYTSPDIAGFASQALVHDGAVGETGGVDASRINLGHLLDHLNRREDELDIVRGDEVLATSATIPSTILSCYVCFGESSGRQEDVTVVVGRSDGAVARGFRVIGGIGMNVKSERPVNRVGLRSIVVGDVDPELAQVALRVSVGEVVALAALLERLRLSCGQQAEAESDEDKLELHPPEY